jgi:ankyrin repeat protein
LEDEDVFGHTALSWAMTQGYKKIVTELVNAYITRRVGPQAAASSTQKETTSDGHVICFICLICKPGKAYHCNRCDVGTKDWRYEDYRNVR